MSQAHTSYTPSPDTLAALAAGDTAALIESHRARFGGWAMEGESDPAPGSGDPAGDPAGADPNADPASGDPADNPDPENTPDPEDDEATERQRRANREAANLRQRLRDAEQRQQESDAVLDRLRAALDPNANGTAEADPDALAGQVETLTSEVSQLRAELLVHELAASNGGNPNALLDSRQFVNTLGALDANAEDYRDQVARAVKDAVSKNAGLAAEQGQAPSRGGTDGAGSGSPTPGSVTQEQFNAMGYKDRVALNRSNPALYQRLAGTGN